MRIYGRTLSEVFSLLPWPYKLVVTLGTAFIIFAVPYSLNFFANMGVQIDRIEPMNFPGIGRVHRGLMDPAAASDGENVILVHTVLNTIALQSGGPADQLAMDVMIERAEKPCRHWMTVNAAFQAKPQDDVIVDGTQLPPGVWRFETPGAVYDPDDKGREWKVFAYTYYWMGDERVARLVGGIVMRTAPDVQGPWGEPQWIMGAGPVQIGGAVREQPPSPYNQMNHDGGAMIRLNTLDPALKDVYFYSRPSVIYAKGFLFMSLSAFTTTSKTPDRVVLLKSIDHGKTWSYAGTPLRMSDLPKVGNGKYTTIGGASLIQYKDKIYLATVFGDRTADGKGADGLGTFMLPFAKTTQGLLAQDAEGKFVVAQHHPRNSVQPSQLGGGYAAYADACRQGMMISEFSSLRGNFQIFKTHKKPVAE